MAISMYDRLEYGDFKLPSLQEMMIAPQYLTQEHEKMEDAFMQNQALAADAATRFQPGVDDAAIQANQQFQSSVEADINDLSKNGLTPGIRRRLLQRKSDFTNNILPLNKAAVDREQWAKVAREAQLKDPSLMVRDPMQVGLDRWIADPTSRELNPISGREIYERTRQEMVPISKFVAERLPQLSKTGIPFKYWAMSASGANPQIIAEAMSMELGINPEDASPLAQLIHGAANNVIQSTGVYDAYGIDSPEAARSWDYARSAYNHALGSTSIQGVTDDFNMRDLLDRNSLARRPRKGSGGDSPSMYPYLDTRTNVKVQGKIDKLQHLIQKVNQLQDVRNNPEALDSEYDKYLAYFLAFPISNKGKQPKSRDEFLTEFLQKNLDVNDIVKDARKLGVDISNDDDFTTMFEKLGTAKKKMAITSKQYTTNLETDPQIYKTFKALVSMMPKNKGLIEGLVPKDLIDENTGEWKPKYQIAFDSEGMIIKEHHNKKSSKTVDHRVNTSLLSDNLTRAIERVKYAYNPSHYMDIELEPEKIEYLRELDPMKYGDLSDEDILLEYIYDIQSRNVRNSVAGTYVPMSVVNKSINLTEN